MQHAINLVERVVGIPQYVFVPEAHHHETRPLQPSAPFGILCRVFRVLAAVNLDDELRVDADEIGYVAINRYLPAKFPAMKLPVAEMPPEAALSGSLFAPQLSCELPAALHGPHPLRSARDLSPSGRGKISFSPMGR